MMNHEKLDVYSAAREFTVLPVTFLRREQGLSDRVCSGIGSAVSMLIRLARTQEALAPEESRTPMKVRTTHTS